MRADITCRSQQPRPGAGALWSTVYGCVVCLAGGDVMAASAQKHASCREFVTPVLAQQGDIDKCFSDAGRWAIVEFG